VSQVAHCYFSGLTAANSIGIYAVPAPGGTVINLFSIDNTGVTSPVAMDTAVTALWINGTYLTD
jgi:hypothetical protein